MEEKRTTYTIEFRYTGWVFRPDCALGQRWAESNGYNGDSFELPKDAAKSVFRALLEDGYSVSVYRPNGSPDETCPTAEGGSRENTATRQS